MRWLWLLGAFIGIVVLAFELQQWCSIAAPQRWERSSVWPLMRTLMLVVILSALAAR